ncbi:hypothetical protein H1C71_028830, partial [Ictidomys tridecemlineatus]
LLPEERTRVWELARAHADETHQVNSSHPPGPLAAPDQTPGWDYDTQAGIQNRDRFSAFIIAGLKKAAPKPISFQKLQEIIQKREETHWNLCIGLQKPFSSMLT